MLCVKQMIPKINIQRPKKQNQRTRSANKTSVTKMAPVAYGTTLQSSRPRLTSRGTYRVQHSEVVGGVTNGNTVGFSIAPGTLNIPGYDFNPAISLLFPWLSGIARNFERFRFHNLSFELVTSQPSTTPGRVYMAIDYDYDDSPSVTKAQLMANHSAVEGPVWQNLKLVADPKSLHRDQPFKYVSTISRPNFVEARTAYCGFLIIAFDCPQTANVFDLKVSYDVEFENPVLETDTTYVSTGTRNSTTALSSTQGANYISVPSPLAGSTASTTPTPIVQAGTPFVPSLIGTVLAAPVTFPFAIDTKNNSTGTVAIEEQFTSSTQSPTTMLSNGANSDAAVFDSNGTFLGLITSLSATALRRLTGTDQTSAPGTIGSVMKSVVNLAMPQLLAQVPTARYIAPFLTSTASLGAAGTWGFGLTSNL
jgi:hypothetical protein